MKPLKRPVKTMVAEAKARITEITAADAIAMHEEDDVVIVDIRDIRERQKLGYISGSFHAPRGMLEFWVDPESPYFKDIFGEDKRFILHCASGWRSALVPPHYRIWDLKQPISIADLPVGWRQVAR